MRNPHFLKVSSWEEARAELSFKPRVPAETAGHALQSLSIFVRDHKHRDLPVDERSLEAHYGAFSVSQSRPGAGEARHMVVDVPYGPGAMEALVRGHEARFYELGPEVDPEDIDERSPSVVVWHDDARFYFVASYTLRLDVLTRIAHSVYG